ncbi:hypothetical protein BKA60DRAFT_655313 [Fusarium oxysporum]|nr:hypothetical protein BKA60DRAFT_655313 [Fusarium oxysporum]
MYPPIEELIDHVWSPPRGVKRQHKSRHHPDNLQYYSFGCFEDQDDVDQRDVQLLKDLFHLDTCEDASLLDGLDVRGVRELFQREGLEGKRAMADSLWNFVLVADESVLKDVASGESIVKAVSLGWYEGFSGWGRMRIPTSYLLDLWIVLSRSGNTKSALGFMGPEKDLDTYVWPGDVSLEATGCFSEVRPLLFHYTGQRWNGGF